jgi:DNA polymerase I
VAATWPPPRQWSTLERPIDTVNLDLFRQHWTDIQDQLIAEINTAYGVFEGRTFKVERFAAWLAANDIPWPLLESGNLDLSDDTFRQQARVYSAVSPLRELRSSLSDLRLNDLAVGDDGRNRTVLSAYRSRTGRNQPSNTKFIFGPSVWLRGLIKPAPGYAVAYVDWSQQEIGIAAALSGDQALQAAYQSGDCYLAFAKQAGAVPHDATKATHNAQRELFKQCMLATQYGMEWQSLALRIAQPGIVARDLLRAHRETYRRFWEWSDAAVDQSMLVGVIHTVFGWPVRIGERVNPRSLRNFPMQANGAEMLRIACCLATERGVEVCAPVHDAVLIGAPLDRIEADIAAMRAAMAEASRCVLDGRQDRALAGSLHGPTRPHHVAARLWPRTPSRAATGGAGCVNHKFVKFPKTWQACLAEQRADGSTYRVALYLLDKASFSENVPLGNAALKRQGVSQRSKWRALQQLRRVGLVAVENRQGRPPLVKVRWKA